VVSEDGRKLIGLAQVKRRGASLHQAGLHRQWPAADFARILALSARQREALRGYLPERAVGLEEGAGRPVAFSEIIKAFETSLRERFDIELVAGRWDSAELNKAVELENEKFRNYLA
jgi:lipoate-protein ligase A